MKVADRIVDNLIAQYGHADTLEKFRKEPQYDDADILETLVNMQVIVMFVSIYNM